MCVAAIASNPGEENMDLEYAVGAALAVLLTIDLLYALIRPERF